MNDDIHVLLLDIPTRIHGYVVCIDNNYTVVINARLNDAERIKAYKHELEHIKRGDFNKNICSDIIEAFTH